MNFAGFEYPRPARCGGTITQINPNLKEANIMKKAKKKQDPSFVSGTRPGAYTTDYDMNNESLDTVDCSDDIFKDKIPQPKKWANPASPPAADPPVPNRAHTEM